jgi:uncharacterized membrane protein
MIVRVLVVVLSLAGLVISLYFTLAYYGRIRKARWVPEILCAREGSSCVTVVQTPSARVFGLPNSLLGIIYYIALILCVGEDWLPPVDVQYRDSYLVFGPAAIFLPFSAATVLLGFYLIYALRRKLHINCPLCYTAHAINAAILVLLLFLAR